MSTDHPGPDPQSPYGQQPNEQQPPSPYETGGAPAQQPASPYQQQGASPYPAAPAYQGQYMGQPYPKNSLGVWAMVLGIVSIVMCGFFAGIPAVVVGAKARRAVREGEADNDGMALAGVITGWIGTGLSVLLIVFYVVVFSLAVSQGDASYSTY
ncbi:DUF4190 domain-containing protein [Myceligenerans cantabricum]